MKTEDRLIINLQTAKDSYQNLEVNYDVFVQSKLMLTDSLINVEPDHLLFKFLSTGIIDRPIEQWIIRNEIRIWRR